MGQLIVRNLENVVKAKLQRRAKRHGRSMEEEVRDILRSVANEEDDPAGGLGTEMAGLFAKASNSRRAVVAWLDRQPRTSVWTTSLTILEVCFGLQIMAAGKRRTVLMQAFEKERMGQRIAAFDATAAAQAADLLAHHATVATCNTGHFEDVAIPVINPWTA